MNSIFCLAETYMSKWAPGSKESDRQHFLLFGPQILIKQISISKIHVWERSSDAKSLAPTGRWCCWCSTPAPLPSRSHPRHRLFRAVVSINQRWGRVGAEGEFELLVPTVTGIRNKELIDPTLQGKGDKRGELRWLDLPHPTPQLLMQGLCSLLARHGSWRKSWGGRAGTRYPAATPTPTEPPPCSGQRRARTAWFGEGWGHGGLGHPTKPPASPPHQGHSGLHRQAVGQPGVPMEGGGGSEVSGDLSAEQASSESLWRCCLFR